MGARRDRQSVGERKTDRARAPAPGTVAPICLPAGRDRGQQMEEFRQDDRVTWSEIAWQRDVFPGEEGWVVKPNFPSWGSQVAVSATGWIRVHWDYGTITEHAPESLRKLEE